MNVGSDSASMLHPARTQNETYIKKWELWCTCIYRLCGCLGNFKEQEKKKRVTMHSPQESHRQDNHQKVEKKKKNSVRSTQNPLCVLSLKESFPKHADTATRAPTLENCTAHNLSAHVLLWPWSRERHHKSCRLNPCTLRQIKTHTEGPFSQSQFLVLYFRWLS